MKNPLGRPVLECNVRDDDHLPCGDPSVPGYAQCARHLARFTPRRPEQADTHRRLTRRQTKAIRASREPNPAVKRTIAKGQRAPKTWDEINSARNGGRDFAT